MPASFYDFVRGLTDAVPPGYSAAGMQAYRHLVFLGASQMVEARYPAVRAQLSDPDWRALIEDFVRQSQWTSNFVGDLTDDFLPYLERTRA